MAGPQLASCHPSLLWFCFTHLPMRTVRHPSSAKTCNNKHSTQFGLAVEKRGLEAGTSQGSCRSPKSTTGARPLGSRELH